MRPDLHGSTVTSRASLARVPRQNANETHVRIGHDVWMPLLALGTGFDRASPRGLSLEAMVTRGIGMGYTHFETAEIYPNFVQVARALRAVPRSASFLTTENFALCYPSCWKRRGGNAASPPRVHPQCSTAAATLNLQAAAADWTCKRSV